MRHLSALFAVVITSVSVVVSLISLVFSHYKRL